MQSFPYSKIPVLLYNTAVVVESYEGSIKNERFKLYGAWEGKTPDD